MGESLLTKVPRSDVGQSLASEAEVCQVLGRDIIGDGGQKLIGKCQKLLSVSSVRG